MAAFTALGLAVGASAGAALATGVAITAGTVATVATVKNIEETKKAGQAAASSAQQQQVAAEKQYAAETKKAEVQNIRSVRQQIREQRITQAAMTNIAAQTGGMGSSALAGGLGSIGSQASSNLSYMSEIAEANTAIGAAQLEGARAQSAGAAKIAIAQSNAAVWGSIGQLSGTIFSATRKT
jgi:hypothetical protein